MLVATLLHIIRHASVITSVTTSENVDKIFPNKGENDSMVRGRTAAPHHDTAHPKTLRPLQRRRSAAHSRASGGTAEANAGVGDQ